MFKNKPNEPPKSDPEIVEKNVTEMKQRWLDEKEFYNTYHLELAKIESAKLGFCNDRGFFVITMDFALDSGWHQGLYQILDDYFHLWNGEEYKERIPVTMTMRLVVDVMRAFNVNEFHHLKGKIVYVIRKDEKGSIVGLKTPRFETDTIILFEDYYKGVEDEKETD